MVAVEAELKALVRNPERIHAALSRRAVGEASGSKPDHETGSRMPTCWSPCSSHSASSKSSRSEKRCVNYRFTAQGRDLLATVVTVPELAGRTFLELETLTTQAYTDALAAQICPVCRPSA
jgi:adenylate cyclase, class 2